MHTRLLILILSLSCLGKAISQATYPAAQSLPYTQSFGTTSFSSYPTGLQGWNGFNGGTISTQALADTTVPRSNAVCSTATASQTTGALYGYCGGGSSCGNGRLYVQGSSNTSNGVNQFCIGIKSGSFTSLSLSYTVEVVNAGAAGTMQGRMVQYRDSATSTWTTISGSVASYTPSSSTNSGDSDKLGDIDTFVVTVSGLTANRTYYFRWAHWRSSGTSVGTAYDDIIFTGLCTAPTTVASSVSAPTINPTSATLQFTRGNGDSTLVFLKSGSAVNSAPSTGIWYNAQNTFGSGSQLGTGNYAVGKTSNSNATINISSLTANTTYFYSIVEYKSANFCYASSSVTGNFKTACTVPSGQASFSSLSPATNSATASLTSGTGGSGRLVKINTTRSFTNPSDGTMYTSNNTYGGSGEQVLYASTGSSFNILGLSSNTKYYLCIYEYNCDSSQRKYLTPGKVDSFVTNLPTSSESDVIKIQGSETYKISSIKNASAPLLASNTNSTVVLQFQVRDGGSDTTDIDTFSTRINSLTFLQSAGNAVDDWSDAIQSIALFNDTTFIASGTVSATNVVFSGSPLLIVPDNTVRTYTMRLTLQVNPNNTGGNLDNDDFGFSLSASNIVLGAGSSQKDPALAAVVSANDSNRIDIVATKITIQQQPFTVGKGVAMTPAVVAAATDMNGNTDLDFNVSLKATSSGNLQGAPIVSTTTNGICTFSNILHNTVAKKIFLTINRNDTINWAITTDSFDINPVTTFNYGDLVLVGYDNNVPAGDKLIMLNMVDILPGTKFCLINACYDLLNNSYVRSNRWYDSDGISPLSDSVYSHEITWNGTNKIAAGSIMCIAVPSLGTSYTFAINGVDSTSKFLVTDNGKGGSSPNMSTSNPDAIFIGQGSWNYYGTYATFDGKILYGLMTGANWYQFSDNVSSVAQTERRSRVHPNAECLKLQGKTSSGNAYGYYTGTRSGSKKTILSNIADPTKWTIASGGSSDDLTAVFPCTNTFTISTPYRDSNYWLGNVNNSWFNCNNWENMTVPDSTTNVVIRDTATNSVDIENSDTASSRYGSVASCKSLTIDSSKTLSLDDNLDYLYVYGDLNLRNGSTLNLQSGSGGYLYVKGNINNYSAVDNINEFNSTLVLNGSSSQSISSSNLNGDQWHNIQINKGSQKVFQLSAPMTLQNLTFTNGIIQTNGYLLTVNGNISGYQAANDSGDYNNNNYIIGKLKRSITASGNYFFPIGDSINGEGYNPVSLEVLTGTGTATAEFTPGDPGDCAMSLPQIFYCGSTMQYMAKYDDMTGEGLWKFTGSNFYYNIEAYPNKVNVNTKPNKLQPPAYTATYRLLKSPIGTTDWTPYVLLGDSCSVSNNYYKLVGKGYSGFSQFAPGGASGLGTALPVELLSFKGTWKDVNTVHLEWATASEKDNDRFEILKSEDGKTFEVVATEKGAGTSYGMMFYQKELPLQTSAYFKLKQVDFDGKYSFSKIIKLNMNQTQKGSYAIHNQMLEIDMQSFSEARIYNLTGALILQSNQPKISLEKFPSNLYLLSIINKDGQAENYKFYK